MKVGDLVRIKKFPQNALLHADAIGKIGIVVICGTWGVDIRILDNGAKCRIAKEDCEVISESR